MQAPHRRRATPADVLDGASLVVFVIVHVDEPWQDSVNDVLELGVESYAGTELADWATLASTNPEWFGSDRTHLPIGGAGAQALAALITRCVGFRRLLTAAYAEPSQ